MPMPVNSATTNSEIPFKPLEGTDQQQAPCCTLRPAFVAIGRLLLLPALVYFGAFALLTFPLLLTFRTQLFADQGDGYNHLWSIWWIHKAIVELHQSPLTSNIIHFPAGISLAGHTLNP